MKHLILDDGEPHLEAMECENCGALYFSPPIRCGSCYDGRHVQAPQAGDDRNAPGVHACVKRGAIGDGFVSAIVDFDGGGNVKANLVNGDLIDFENNKLGEPVKLVTYTVDTDDDGNEAVAFGFEKV